MLFSSSRNTPAILLALLSLPLLSGCPQDNQKTAVEGASKLLATSGSELTSSDIEGSERFWVMSKSTKSGVISNPILFVTQVPTPGDPFASRLSTFANHLPSVGSTPRGGDLMIRYPDGTLRNLTREAGFGTAAEDQGASAIAVREPTVHWSGTKAVFSMIIGAPPRYQHNSSPWQLYEVSGLGRGQTAVITKLPNQPAYNNVSPIYDSNDRILFTSDRPRDGQAHLHPQLDEYESTPTIVGLYSMAAAGGDLKLLNHTPSGVFSPTLDSFGRVIFTRWDHLQRDQQAEVATYGAFDFPNENASSTRIAKQPEQFPEARYTVTGGPYGTVNGFTYNFFTPWQMNQDGTDEVTLNHIGRHEMSFGYMGKSFAADNAMSENTGSAPRANQKRIAFDAGIFNIKEDPAQPGMFIGVYAREFAEGSSGQLLRITGGPTLNPEQMTITTLTPGESTASLPGGRFRNPLPTTTGTLIATYTPSATIPTNTNFELRLRKLMPNPANMVEPTDYLTTGITRTVSWWDPDNRRSYSGVLWELDPVEVVARTRPPVRQTPLPAGERSVFEQEGVNEAQFKNWMAERNLALVVVRNQTHRDRGDRQQPFNLRVPGGVSTTTGSGLVYDISHFQMFQANLIRAYDGGTSGRRPIAQAIATNFNPPHNGPAGSSPIASDGSSASFVPARRAMTWQTTDLNGNAIVRERLWVTMQPGEIRTCSGCHGENVAHQAGGAPTQGQTLAVRNLLRHWKAQYGSDTPPQPIRVNGGQPLVPGAR